MNRKIWIVAMGDLSQPYIAATLHCREDTCGLRQLGWDSTLISQADDQYTPPEDIKEIAICKNRPLIYRLIFELKIVAKIFFGKEKPDFVLMRGMGLFFLVSILILRKIPYGVELCGPTDSFLNPKSLLKFSCLSDNFILKHASIVIALTQELGELAAETNPQALVTVTGVGVDTKQYEISNNMISFEDEKLCLGFIGAIHEDRGLGRIFKTIVEFKKKNFECNLIIVGDGPYRKSAEELAKSLGIFKKVKFLGWKPPEKVSESIAECDLTIAFYEHTPALTVGGINPMKVWTSLSAGKAVFLHNPGRYNAYQNIPGIFDCPPTEPSDIAEILRDIYIKNGRKGIHQAGLLGREYVEKNVTWLRHAEMISKTLNDYFGRESVK